MQFFTAHWQMPDLPSELRGLRLAEILSDSSSLCTGHDVLWCGVSLWPSQVSGHLLWLSSLPVVGFFAYLLTGRAWDKGNKESLIKYKHYLAKPQNIAVLSTPFLF